jgi:hypothetical protein
MIFWKGHGYLALVIAVAIGAVTAFIFSKIGSTEDLGAAVGAIVSGVVIWVVGSRLNSATRERTMIDKKTGKEVILKQNNSLLFIKMQYWAFIVGGIGLIMLVDVLIHGKSSF